MKVTALVDRFGSNRMNAAEPGKLLKGCSCVAVPFAGGMCEVPHFTANIVLVNDLDRHVINLCEMVRSYRRELCELWDATPFHQDVLALAQRNCKRYALSDWRENTLGTDVARRDWAYHYFIASWMTRGGKGGTKGEFDAGLSIRWKSGGGDSVVRFRSATEGLDEWEKVMRRCTFTTLDAFDFIAECKKRDIKENGIYCDPPWVADGDKYTFGAFDEKVNWCADPDDKSQQFERITRHEVLARMLDSFTNTRIVVRYGDHPLVRELYPESEWTWHRITSRTQANTDKAEVLLERRR